MLKCPSCQQYQAAGQTACPDFRANFAAKKVVPTNHQVRYMLGMRDAFKAAKDLTPLGAIRIKCIDCSGGSIRLATECPLVDCPLWPYRLGKRPKFSQTAVVPGMPQNLVEG